MAIAAAAVIVPLGLLFFISGLVVNLIQAACFITIKPLSKSLYRRINREVAELLWLELIWLFDWWAGIKVKIYTDRETLKKMGKEHALVISNHRSDIDWLVGWVLAQRSGCLGSAVAVMKKSSKFLPVIGWSMWFSEYLFLERSWAKDEGTIKGFVAAVSHMRSFVPAIYDVTVAIPKSSPAPTMVRMFKGQPSVVHVHIKRHLMKELPESDDAVAQWCKDVFVAKDSLLDKHNAEDTFSGQELQEIPRPVKPLLVAISWVCLVIFGVLKFLQWSSLLSSWRGIAVSAFCLAVVTVLMHILILFSQSERSTPTKVAPAKPKKVSEAAESRQDKQQ
ncbi:1-acyl-sn-glycerol-3-phosphate acyltransferase 2-like isoform X2 [Mangifera indica]|uniref:1-acyl-sn-glycerol-3-phosphate acyltransferase 2-like isoform X2 n=1 Tax=Mangifera indica TaxID=29780 RepID=UPI001CFC16C0|nr:1-acyl-sn-glycerol-3-phosphate acyltransferase 2-like isoform X2 [Mangifera indica]